MAGETLDDVALFTGAPEVRRGDRVFATRSGVGGAMLMQGALVLPAVTTADEGKQLTVDASGAWVAQGGSTASRTPIWTGNLTWAADTAERDTALFSGQRFSDYDLVSIEFAWTADGNGLAGTKLFEPTNFDGVDVRSSSVVLNLRGTPGSTDTSWRGASWAMFPTSIVPAASQAPVSITGLYGIKFRSR